MHAVTLRAHFDGKQIRLDDPYELKPNAKLFITVFRKQTLDEEHEAWLNLSRTGLEKAYEEDEIEYSLEMIKRPNPDYERR